MSVLEGQITIGASSETPHDFTGEAGAGCIEVEGDAERFKTRQKTREET